MPQNVAVAATGEGEATVTWDAVAEGALYTVERRVDGGDWTAVGNSVSTTTFADEACPAG